MGFHFDVIVRGRNLSLDRPLQSIPRSLGVHQRTDWPFLTIPWYRKKFEFRVASNVSDDNPHSNMVMNVTTVEVPQLKLSLLTQKLVNLNWKLSIFQMLIITFFIFFLDVDHVKFPFSLFRTPTFRLYFGSACVKVLKFNLSQHTSSSVDDIEFSSS